MCVCVYNVLSYWSLQTHIPIKSLTPAVRESHVCAFMCVFGSAGDQMCFGEPISTMPFMPEAFLCSLLLQCHVCLSVCACLCVWDRERLIPHTPTEAAWNVLWCLRYGKLFWDHRGDAPLLWPAQTHCLAVTHERAHTHTRTPNFFTSILMSSVFQPLLVNVLKH